MPNEAVLPVCRRGLKPSPPQMFSACVVLSEKLVELPRRFARAGRRDSAFAAFLWDPASFPPPQPRPCGEGWGGQGQWLEV